jgi:hypothetical protein
MIQVIKTENSKTTIVFDLCGKLAQETENNRGIKQGCPLFLS